MTRALWPWLLASFAAAIPGAICIASLEVPGAQGVLSGAVSFALANIFALVWLAIVVAAFVRLQGRALWLLTGAPVALYIPIFMAALTIACARGPADCL